VHRAVVSDGHLTAAATGCRVLSYEKKRQHGKRCQTNAEKNGSQNGHPLVSRFAIFKMMFEQDSLSSPRLPVSYRAFTAEAHGQCQIDCGKLSAPPAPETLQRGRKRWKFFETASSN
jgi:hypothetical protein